MGNVERKHLVDCIWSRSKHTQDKITKCLCKALVLVLAGIELIFLPVTACFGFRRRRLLIVVFFISVSLNSFRKFCNIREIWKFCSCCLGTVCRSVIRRLEKLYCV